MMDGKPYPLPRWGLLPRRRELRVANPLSLFPFATYARPDLGIFESRQAVEEPDAGAFGGV
jgi:hypothetical protein